MNSRAIAQRIYRRRRYGSSRETEPDRHSVRIFDATITCVIRHRVATSKIGKIFTVIGLSPLNARKK